MTSRIQLEPEAQGFADAAEKPPWLFTLDPAQGRLVLDEVQSGSVSEYPVNIEDLTIADGPSCTRSASQGAVALSGHAAVDAGRRVHQRRTAIQPASSAARVRSLRH
jgi:hypothetical protein